MAQIVLIGGPPGVGKTTALRRVAERVPRCAWLDGDNVWRIRPFEVTAETRSLVEGNIVHVLRSFLQARYRDVFLTWVLHDEALIERLLAPLRPFARDVAVLHLVASPDVLRARCESDPARGSVGPRVLERLAQIEALPYPRIDTSELSPDQVAERILEQLGLPS